MNNPIIEHELSGMLRTRRALVLQVAVAAIFAILVILRWPTDAQVDLSGTQSRQVFRLFGYGLMTALILLVPIFPAVTIVKEKIRGTLALLLNSPLSPESIYFGKLVGQLGYVFLLLAMSVPAAAACYAMGGISLSEILLLYVVLALLSIQYSALGLLVSSYAGSMDSAIRLTYGFILLLAIVAMGPHLFTQGSEGPVANVADLLRCVSPIPAMMEVLNDIGAGSQGIAVSTGIANKFIVLSIVLTVAFMVATIARFRGHMLDRSRAQGVITDDMAAGERRLRRFVFLIDPQRRKSGIGPLTNPVMVKEFRSRRFGRSHWIFRLVAVCALVSLGLTYAATLGTMDWGVNTIGGIMVVLQVALIVLITPSLAAGLISAERESGGWQILVTTPLSFGTILRGKLLSVMWTLLLILCATLPGYLVMLYIKPEMTQQVIRVLITLLLTAILAVMLSATVSSFFRRTAAATICSYALLVAICAGPMFFWMERDSRFGHATVEAALTVDPMAAALHLIDAPGFGQYNLVPANWWFVGGFSFLCLVVLSIQTWRLMRPQ